MGVDPLLALDIQLLNPGQLRVLKPRDLARYRLK